MAVPVASGQGSNTTNAGAVAANLPASAPAIGDRAFLVIAHRDNAVGTPTPSDTAGFGTWTQVPGSPVVQGAARLTVWTAVVESTTPTAPVVSDSGDHQQHRLFYVSHVLGTPEVHVTQSSVDATSDVGGNAACPTTTRADCLVFLFAASDTPDANGTAQYSAVANVDLTSVAELADNSVQTGGGSAKLIASGQKLVAGTIADWTYTKANAGVKAHLVVAVSPPATGTTFFGSLAMPVTFGKAVSGIRTAISQLSSPISFGKAVSGHKTTFGQITLPITIGIATAGIRVGQTFFGSLTLPVTFGKVVSGQRTTFGQVVLPVTFGKAVSGLRTTFGQVVLPVTFGKAVSGRRTTFGQLVLPVTFGKEINGLRTTFGEISLPIILGKDVSGHKTTFGSVDFPITASIFVDGFGWSGPQTHFGQLAMPLTFEAMIEAERTTFGQVVSPLIFGATSEGFRQTFSALELPITFETEVGPALVTMHGSVELDLILTIDTSGIIKIAGILLNDALAVYLGDIEVEAAYVGSQQVWP